MFERKARVSIRCLLIAILLFSSVAVAGAGVSADNWREVARFSGTRTLGYTDSFNVTHSEWRARWSVVLDDPENSFFSFIIRTGRQGSVGSILREESGPTNGILVVQTQNSTFFNEVQTDVKYWEVVIEENLESPLVGSQKEIKPCFATLILASIVSAVTLCMGLLVYFKKRKG